MSGQRATLMLGVVLMLVSGVVMGVGVFGMQDRLSGRDLEMVYFQKPIHLESFNFAEEPVTMTVLSAEDLAGAGVQSTPIIGEPLGPQPTDAAHVIRYTYRGATVDFPVIDEADARLFPDATDPDRLGLLDEWFKVLPMVTGATTSLDAAERVAEGELPARLVIAARYKSPELKPQWADTQRANWVYRIAELHAPQDDADAPITLIEKTYTQLDIIHTPGKRTPPELIPTPEERSRDLWQHYVMQEITPAQFFRAKDRNLDAALEAMGWTWPVSLGGGFGVVTAIIVIGLGLKSKPELAA